MQLVEINETLYSINHIVGIGTVQYVDATEDEQEIMEQDGLAIQEGWFYDVLISDNLTEYVYAESFEACNESRNKLILTLTNKDKV